MSCTPCKIDFENSDDWEQHIKRSTKILVQRPKINGNKEEVKEKDDLNQTILEKMEEDNVDPKNVQIKTHDAPILLKRKKNNETPKKTYKTNKYKCEKCHFTTMYKYNLPQHMKRIHGKCPKTNPNNSNPLTRTSSTNSTSSKDNLDAKKTDKQDDEHAKVKSLIAKDLRSHLNNLRKSENCLDTKKTTKAENDKGGNEKR